MPFASFDQHVLSQLLTLWLDNIMLLSRSKFGVLKISPGLFFNQSVSKLSWSDLQQEFIALFSALILS
jgi:hypothetical protein